MRSLIWFRRDLRVSDNTALSFATKQSTEGTIAVYFVTAQQWKDHDDADCKVSFWIRNLGQLSASLAKLNIPLLIHSCDTFAQIPAKIVSLARKYKCSSVFFNREYEVNEFRRDRDVKSDCLAADIGVRSFHDRVIVPPRDISTQQGKFYSVFTPYRRVWETKAIDLCELQSKPRKQKELEIEPSPIPTKVAGFKFSSSLDERWQSGEAEAQKRLKTFATKIADYNQARDIPSLDGTSQLSPYLAAGVISPRQCMAAALTTGSGEIDDLNDGAKTWISELAWRDFYTAVMVGFPRVSRHQPFKLATNAIQWRSNEKELEAWKQGQTGYPIVDAGMRQLNETGWMHNRLRMVTAMFLTKHLLVDWRLGERYFMEKTNRRRLSRKQWWLAVVGVDGHRCSSLFSNLQSVQPK